MQQYQMNEMVKYFMNLRWGRVCASALNSIVMLLECRDQNKNEIIIDKKDEI